MSVNTFGSHPAKILIVEDEALLALDLAQSLRDFEYDVVGTAARADQAIRDALQSKPDLILMDIHLRGESDGIEAYSKIKEQLDIPVVYLTGYSEKDVLERAKKTEPYGYLGKPVSLAELRSTVETALYKHRADKRLRESESRLKAMVDSLPMGAVYREGDSVYLNMAAEAMIGYSRDEITSLNEWFITLYKDDAEKIKGFYETDREAKFPTGRTVTLIRKDGTPRSVSFVGYVHEKGDVWLMVDETEKSHAKEELRRSEDLHRTTLANISDAIFITDDSGAFVYISPNIHLTFGYTPEEVENLGNVSQLIGSCIFEWPQLERQKEIDNIEQVIVDKSGKEHVLLVSVKRLDIRGGTVLYTCRDITDRKKTEDALRESEERYRRIVHTASEGIWVMDREFRTAFVNPRLAEMLGYTVDEMLGRTVDSFMFDEDLADHRQNMELRRKGKDQSYERRFRTKDGNTVWAIISTTALKDSGGDFAGSFGMLTDITDRKKVEKDLQEREALIRSISDNLPSGMIYQIVRHKDGSRKFTYLSKNVRDFYGCSPEEAINDPGLIYGRVHPEDRNRVFIEEEQAHQARSDFRTEARMINPSGDVRWSYFASSPRRLADGSTNWSGLEIDITERKKAEEEMQSALREKEVLLREIHHRVKNNLAVVSSLLRLQSRYVGDDAVRDMFEEAEARIRSMALAHAHLYQTDNLSEITTGKYLGSLLNHLSSSVGKLGGNITLSSEVEDIALQIDTAIPLGFIVTELISNALKHAFPDGRRGELKLSLRSLGDGEFELAVKDNGVGMPSNPDLTHSESCGLTLVDVFVKQINGDVELRTQGGTEVRVRFPVGNDGKPQTSAER